MRLCLLSLTMLPLLACNSGVSAELDRVRAQQQYQREKRSLEVSESSVQSSAQSERVIETAYTVLGERLNVSAERVRTEWTLAFVGNAVGLVDQNSGLCAVLLYQADQLAVYSIGRPPEIPPNTAVVFAGLPDETSWADALVDNTVEELQAWRIAHCDGIAPEPDAHAQLGHGVSDSP